MNRSTGLLTTIAAYALVASSLASDEVQFNRDVRPILADKCFACHGPDQRQRKADLRLDHEEIAKGPLGDSHPIVAGKPDESEVYRRVTAADAEERMPPALSGKVLSAAEIETLRRWIAEGAKWEPHWSLVSPRRPVPPAVADGARLRNAIDAFVVDRLVREGLTATGEADRTTLIRRVTLDLTGLPPTPAEVDRFMADTSPDAYERLVDRLLASPRYGERMAAHWLDAARYADTSGYQTDGVRTMWRWRDWVIDAYNRNLPFDRFTIEQLAGDQLRDATLEQRIATGFNRNHRGNAEGGIIPEEYAVEYVVDRVDTTATVWLGLTMGCARCHDHKFDPITQREYYQMFALFNNIPERGRAIKVGNSPPMIASPTRDQQQRLVQLETELAAAEREFSALADQIAAEEAAWQSAFHADSPLDWAPARAVVAHYPLDSLPEPGEPAKSKATEPVSTVTQEPATKPSFVAGLLGSAAEFDGASEIKIGNVADFGYFDKFTLSAWISPRAAGGTVLARMSDQTDAEGYSLVLAEGRVQLNLVKRWLDDSLRVETAEPVVADGWHHVAATYDGSRTAGGVAIYVDGLPQKIRVVLDELNQSFSTNSPLKFGGGGNGPRFHGLVDELRIYKTNLTADEVSLLATPDAIDAILTTKPSGRTRQQSAKLRAYFLDQHASPSVKSALAKVNDLRQRIVEFKESFPTTMVMEEMPQPRETFVLARGQYDKPTERVAPAVPGCFPPMRGERADRLALARWLVDPQNPLVARVAVNRFWQSHFGVGLVKTVDDFGAQGDPPSHPELLDWLATEFIACGWDMKAMHRLIVTSATYRQSSQADRALQERDPENRLLAHGPRFRLSAEAIRDTALATGGLLVEEVGGPSVHPYQPPGLWKELTGGADVEQDHGRNLYRRSLYTFWKRTIAPPSMMTFDASGREACWVRMARTNTPLQALALLNEVTYVEAARGLAARVMRETPLPLDRIRLAFRHAVARPPSDRELTILTAGLEKHLARFRQQPDAARKLLDVGELPADETLDQAELAAYAATCNLILNLDEVVTKE